MSEKRKFRFRKLNLNAPDYDKSPRIRRSVQLFFLMVTLYTGWRFVLFVNYIQRGGTAVSRPPGVEAFLPISSLVSLKYWIVSGDFNTVHPAGLVLLLAFMVMGLLLKRSFCSWVCPIGFLSEYLWKGGEKLMGKNFQLPRWLDYPLRSLKYLILLFFAWGIFFGMDSATLKSFVYGSYNRIADISMLYFFTRISLFALVVILVLLLLSVFIKNFWCRYLCPYGALMGFLSLFSPAKITRNVDTCTDCRACTEACPARIIVHKKTRIRSDECTACLTCTSVCPEPDTLSLKFYSSKKRISAKLLAVLILLIFLLFTGWARLTGHWQNKISVQQYKTDLRQMEQVDFTQ